MLGDARNHGNLDQQLPHGQGCHHRHARWGSARWYSASTGAAGKYTRRVERVLA